jgi:hypothetical protein
MEGKGGAQRKFPGYFFLVCYVYYNVFRAKPTAAKNLKERKGFPLSKHKDKKNRSHLHDWK